MLLFRSEEHVRRWGQGGDGEVVGLAAGWEMAKAWFGDRLESGWRRTPASARRMLGDLGLDGPFWELSAD